MFTNGDMLTLCEVKKKAGEMSYWLKTKSVTVMKEFDCPDSVESCFFEGAPDDAKSDCAAKWRAQDASPITAFPGDPKENMAYKMVVLYSILILYT